MTNSLFSPYCSIILPSTVICVITVCASFIQTYMKQQILIAGNNSRVYLNVPLSRSLKLSNKITERVAFKSCKKDIPFQDCCLELVAMYRNLRTCQRINVEMIFYYTQVHR